MAKRLLKTKHYVYGEIMPEGAVIEWPEDQEPSAVSEETDLPITHGPGSSEPDEAPAQRSNKPAPKPVVKKT